jgi:hypothetical protein
MNPAAYAAKYLVVLMFQATGGGARHDNLSAATS